MSRRTAIAGVAGTLLLCGFAGPALAGPATTTTTDRETVCVRTDRSGDPDAKGICVWVPITSPLLAAH